MRQAKQGDSPSGFCREVTGRYRPPHAVGDLNDVSMRVKARAHRLLAEQPHLATEDPRTLFSRMIVSETAPGYESALNRAAFGLLLVQALDRRDALDVTSGDAA